MYPSDTLGLQRYVEKLFCRHTLRDLCEPIETFGDGARTSNRFTTQKWQLTPFHYGNTVLSR